jgi:hypothetical protein
MLRITTYDELTATKFVIEGKLVGPWVMELRKCWQAAASALPCKSIFLDLTEVTFIDAEGRELLAAMRENGARLVASGLMTQMIDEVIDAASKNRTN